MPYLFARLGRLVDTSHREVLYRSALHVDEVAEDVASLAEDELVLLQGLGPPWLHATLVRPLPWPDVEHPRALWQARERPLDVVLVQALASYGAWHVDPRGVPCEIGIGRPEVGVGSQPAQGDCCWDSPLGPSPKKSLANLRRNRVKWTSLFVGSPMDLGWSHQSEGPSQNGQSAPVSPRWIPLGLDTSRTTTARRKAS